MKNPVPIILIGVAIMIFINGGGLIVPAIMMFIAFNFGQKKKRNSQNQNQPRNRRGNNQDYDPYQRRREEPKRRREYEQRQAPRPAPRKRPVPKPKPKSNPYKTSGVVKYKDYDYEGAIEDFKKALEIDSSDIPTHFNIACAYSLTEQKEAVYKHIDQAVRLGFKDFEKVKTHDAFAYIRIQNDFDAFEKNGFRLTSQMDIPQGGDETVDPLLLERLKKLAELRDRGILTETEFLVQKEKLLG